MSRPKKDARLKEEQIESLIKTAERAARGYITSKLHKGELEDLEITVEAKTDGELTFDIEVRLDGISEKGAYQGLADGAVEAAHTAISDELERLAEH